MSTRGRCMSLGRTFVGDARWLGATCLALVLSTGSNAGAAAPAIDVSGALSWRLVGAVRGGGAGGAGSGWVARRPGGGPRRAGDVLLRRCRRRRVEACRRGPDVYADLRR